MSREFNSEEGPSHEKSQGVWAYVSASRLNLWLRCPHAFRLRYIEGITTPTTPALFFGSRIHGALERWYRHRQLGIDLHAADIAEWLHGDWLRAAEDEGMVFDTVAQEQNFRTLAGRLIEAYIDHVPADEPKPLAVEAVMEAPLIDPDTGEDLGIPLLGIVDLIVPEKEGPIIADFKTSARSSAPLEISHEIQLGCYAHLFRMATGQQEAGIEIRSLIKTKKPKVEFHGFGPRTQGHFRRLFRVIRAYLDDLDGRQFLFRPGIGCSMCDFVDTHCRSECGDDSGLVHLTDRPMDTPLRRS